MAELNRRAVQHGVGDVTGARLETAEIPQPGPDELLVELVAAPINPAEILMLQGEYGYGDTVPPVPRAMGIEGVGRVVAGATERIPAGTLVSLAGNADVFADYRIVPAARALVLPDDVDVDAFALGFINTQAVLAMFAAWPELSAGDWIMQNAANSGYGRVLDVVAARRGIHLVNVVRSERAAASISDAAGPVVIDGDDLADRVLEVTGGARPRVAVDAVGGSSTGRLAASIEPGGRVVVYGLMSGEPCTVDTRLVVFSGIRLEGFWMPRSMAELGQEVLAGIADEALEIVRTAALDVPVERRYPLGDLHDALAHAARGERDGKILMTR